MKRQELTFSINNRRNLQNSNFGKIFLKCVEYIQ